MQFPKDPTQWKQHAEIAGGSVIGLRYNEGILIASDVQLCYGTYKMEKEQQRVFKISDGTIIAFSGDYADGKEVLKKLHEKQEADEIAEDGYEFLEPSDYCTYLARLHYYRRNKMDPFLNSHVVGGLSKKGEPFLGSVDVHGNTIQNNDYYLTGIATYFCGVLLANAGKPETLTEADARKVIEECFKVLHCRDKTASNKIQVGKVDKEGVSIDEAYEFETKWDFDRFSSYTNEHSRDIRFWF